VGKVYALVLIKVQNFIASVRQLGLVNWGAN